MKQLISQGAEAQIFLEGNLIIKERVPKTYRVKELDGKIRKLRTRIEISILERASKIIPVPNLDKRSSEKEFKVVMEFIDGKKLADYLDSFSDLKRTEVCRKIGENVGLLHNNNIIHGDLTTSNMILKDSEVYFIDFGLSLFLIK